MLIVIAGQIGVGKTTMARAVSERLAIPCHSVDQDKIELGHTHPQFQRWIECNIPFPDEFRIRVFESALLRLRGLAEFHRHAIVEDVFHRKPIREPFFDQAGRLFGGILVTTVEVDESLIQKRLHKRMTHERHIAGYGMYLSLRARFEPFQRVDYTFNNNGNLDESLSEYLSFLRRRLVFRRT